MEALNPLGASTFPGSPSNTSGFVNGIERPDSEALEDCLEQVLQNDTGGKKHNQTWTAEQWMH